MALISEQQLKDIKKSDTIVIYGSGYSINKLTDLDYHCLQKFDSISFNWFCFSNIPTTYYLIREQANIKKRVSGKENIKNFYNIMNHYYGSSCLIIHDLKNHSPDAYDYSSSENRNKFISNYVVVKDTKLNNNNSGVKMWRDKSIFDSGIYHGKNTLTNALHFAVWMRYKKIIFEGVDLYDSKYFWMKNNEIRHTVKNKKQDNNSQHQTTRDVLSLIKSIKINYPKIKLFTGNHMSLLSNYIEVRS